MPSCAIRCAAAFLYLLGTPLVLGSWIGLAVMPFITALLIVRIFIEESTLRKGLPGYAEPRRLGSA